MPGLIARAALAAAVGCAALSAAAAPNLVANGGFEADGAAVEGVGYVGQGNKLSSWQVSFPIGAARNTATGAFFDNGVVPEGRCVAVLQNLNAIWQRVGGVRSGRLYRLALRANGRASDAPKHGGLRAEVNGTTVIERAPVQPVGFGKAYHELEALFRAGSGAVELRIGQTSPDEGVSVLLDDVRIEDAGPDSGQPAVAVNPASVASGPVIAPGSDLTDVEWIWSRETTRADREAPVGRRWFRREIAVPVGAAVRRATLTFTADNEARAMLNGRLCGWADNHTRLYVADVTHLVRPGRNSLVFAAANLGDRPNPAGLIAKLTVSLRRPDRTLIVCTDRAWVCSSRAEASRADGAAQTLTTMGGPPWQWVGPPSRRVSRSLPDFIVPGQERAMGLLRRMFALHLSTARPASTLWDIWIPMSSLWAAADPDLRVDRSGPDWARALLARRISSEGYVATHQHRGFGHSEGWPIPLYMQTGGIGFHFSLADDVFASWVPRKARPEEWTVDGCRAGAVDPVEGWRLTLTGPAASVTSPVFDVPMAAAPVVRVEWRSGGVRDAVVQWATAERPDFDDTRQVEFERPLDAATMGYSDVLVYRSPAWSSAGRLTRLRLTFRGANGDTIALKSVITPADTRHNVNNPAFLIGSADTAEWTGDTAFLRANIGRMRHALRFMVSEFRLRQSKCVDMAWFGHDGTGGFTRDAAGRRQSRYAMGVGCNYWDLLPFGGKDALATTYCYAALRRMAALERAIAAHPEWGIATDPEADPAGLDTLAQDLRAAAPAHFWNTATGRFAANRDADGMVHDYGYTFVNCEAIAYGLAGRGEAQSIMDWLDGRRAVAGDTSQGADIYRWRFAARASTRRNVDWYSGMWDPENVPFGYQVQDGGAVLGFSYHDLMARLLVRGPNDAWRRLRAVLEWFADVEAEGGYRAYYARPGRGTMQGGGPPGGLGMDVEFIESVLVPQVMVYGFLGFRPGMDGFSVDPRLPTGWPSLTVTRARYHGLVMSITAAPGRVQVRVLGGSPTGTVRFQPPPGVWRANGKTVPRAGLPVPSRPGSVLEFRGRHT